MDPNNPVVQLCTRGMQAETEGRNDEARALFKEAWNDSVEDYDACMAAHFLTRHQDSAYDILHWNKVALQRAWAVDDDRVKSF